MLHRKLPEKLANHWELLSGSKPTSDDCFESKSVQIIYNCTQVSWSDTDVHYHTNSDEIYIVLEGAMNLTVNGKSICIEEGEYLCVARHEPHQLLSVKVPHKSFVIRGPSIQDKIIV